MAENKPQDDFGRGLAAPDSKEGATEFTDRADAMLRWKQKTAASKLSEMEKHTEGCGSCGLKMKKCACASKTASARNAAENVKTAFIRAVNPTSAASSIIAREGELVVKMAGPTKDALRKFLRKVNANPYARNAAISGVTSAGFGAATAPSGHRTSSAVKSGLLGAGAGVLATELSRQLAKAASVEDDDIAALKSKLLRTVGEYRDLRTKITTGPKEPKARLPRIPPELFESLPQTKTANLKDILNHLKDPTSLALMGMGGLAGGGSLYAASRPKQEFGGKSSAEIDLEGLVASQKARGEEGASFPRRLKNRYVEFSKGLATDFRKSPGSAAAMGAITGATAGALAAKLLGAGK